MVIPILLWGDANSVIGRNKRSASIYSYPYGPRSADSPSLTEPPLHAQSSVRPHKNFVSKNRDSCALAQWHANSISEICERDGGNGCAVTER
jgi:hypothetical protein